VEAILRRRKTGPPIVARRYTANPENTGSQRLLAVAERGERFDRAMWTATAAATGGAGNSNALVGTPETVAAALLDYYDLGIEILSARGYDLLEDAVDFGRQVIPIIREEVAKRDRERAAAATAPNAFATAS
jgi:alkanesulfonate monooxygenase